MTVKLKEGHKRMLITMPTELIEQLTTSAWEAHRTRQAHIIKLLSDAMDDGQQAAA